MKRPLLIVNFLFSCFFLLYLWNPLTLSALEPAKTITQYSVQVWNMESGLPGNSVYALRQTRDGYLWIGTPDGLVRFDGHKFESFTREENPQLKDNVIRALYEDRNGALWIGTSQGGLSKYEAGRFITYPLPEHKFLHKISSIAGDSRGNLWIGSLTGGLTCLENGRFTTYTSEHGLPHNQVRFIHTDKDGNLWVATAAGVARLIKPGVFETYSHQALSSYLHTTCLYDNEAGNLWIGTGESGLFRLKDGDIKAYGNKQCIPHTIVTYLFQDKRKNLWIGTDGGGLTRMSNNICRTLPGGDGLADGHISCIYEDREGNLWVGTLDGGLHCLRDSKFTITTTREGLIGDYIGCIHQDRTGGTWIGTQKGLNRLENGEVTLALTTAQGLFHNQVLSLYEDPAGTLWIGTLAGLNTLDTGKPFNLSKLNRLAGERVKCISGDKSGNTWLGTENGLYRYGKTGGTLNRFTRRDGLSSNFIQFIFEDGKNRLWVGTDNGLNYIKDGIIKRKALSSEWTGKYFRCAHQDDQGNLWFGTDSGLILLGEQEKNVLYTSQCGLVENYVYSILEDHGGCLWLAGRNGITRVKKKELEDYARGKIQRLQPDSYNEKDGMKSRWCTGSGHKARDGKFWFPTSMGAAVIDPDSIATHSQPPPVVIEKLIVDGESVDIENRFMQPETHLDKEKARTDRDILELPPGTKRLEFYYTAPSFINPAKITFKLKLQGYDNDWVDVGSLHSTTYTGLPPGPYTLTVIARGSGGAWNREGVSFSFYMKPYWYKTWWAFSMYIFSAFFGVFFFVKWRSHKLQKEKIHLEQIVKERTAEIDRKNIQLREQSEKLKELDQAKSRFFANISHEFRTPLTLIIGPLEQILSGDRDSGLKQKAALMLRNSRRLLDLINQLLDLSKLDSGRMKLRASQRDIVPFLKGVVHSFDSLVAQKDLTLNIHSAEDHISLYYDAEKLEKVICNLLFNAIKFTPTNGEISVTLSHIPEPAPGSLCISVRDTGIGIPAAQIKHIFDRFYQGEGAGVYSQQGTGIGLALSFELVKLHHGEITVNSREGEGSEFIVRLPMGDAHLVRGEIVDLTDAAVKQTDTGEIPPLRIALRENDEYEQEPVQIPDHMSLLEPGGDMDGHEKNIILVVEDSADVLEYIRGALEPFYIVAEARDGAEGIKKAGEIIPDLIISDIMMPITDGYELCREVKNRVATSHIPVILLTARAAEENIVQGLETGADDYIIKPFSTPVLLARIKNLIDLRRQLQENLKREMALQPVKTSLSTIDKQFIGQLQQLIEKHLSDPEFNVTEMSRKLKMSSATLYRKINGLTGQSPNAYIRSYRLKRAVRLLKANFGSVTDVAYEVGFSSSAYFTKCFKDKFHQTPSDLMTPEKLGN